MEVIKVNFEEESYRVLNINVINESIIEDIYRGMGYIVFSKYYNDLILGKYNISKEVLKVFKKYDSGYPDLLLINKEGIVEFVEIKINGDSLRPNQVTFNNELGELVSVTVAHFYKSEDNTSKEVGDVYFSTVNKELTKTMEGLIYTALKKKFKPFWIISKLYDHFGEELLKKKYINKISKRLNIPKDKIVWFIKENLTKKSP